MFIIEPFFSWIDFAPELWKALFLPHMSSIVGWYSEERHSLVMEVIPDSADLSFTTDFDQFFNGSLIFSTTLDQAEKLQKLEQLYGESLDENTRLYAEYYKDCMNFDSMATKKVIPMFPIAEPPMTPLHEVSWSIPDYVSFGPILPKSAGFSPFLKYEGDGRDSCRLNVTSHSMQKLEEESALWNYKSKTELG